MTCHNDQEYAGAFSMDTFVDPKVAVQSAATWAKILDKLDTGKMPPAPEAPLAPADAATMMGWIERTYGLSASNRNPATADPGRVTARRLNRNEYNNTVHDLLGVTLKPADEFPVDDSGYGFDNIGDVLTISPMLMEKYMRAARTVSKAAVFGEAYPGKPTLLSRLQPKKDQDDLPAVGNVLPFSIRGALYATYHFPVDGEYEFHWRYGNTRGTENLTVGDGPAPAARGGGSGGRGGSRSTGGARSPPATGAEVNAAPGASRGRIGRGAISPEEQNARDERERTGAPPELMVFTIDGKRMYEYVVEGTQNHNYSRGETVVRARLTAGDHALRVSWPAFANLANPTVQYGSDGRRKLFIDYLDILGPYAPSKARPAGFTPFHRGAPGKYLAACAAIVDIGNAGVSPAGMCRSAAAPGPRTVQRQDSFELRVAIEAMLMSPNPCSGWATGGPPRAAPSCSGTRCRSRRPAGAAAVCPTGSGDYELASRLSFLLSSMPDERRRAAMRQRLHEPAVLEVGARECRWIPGASLVNDFASRLNLRRWTGRSRMREFRAVDDEPLDAMRQETRLLFRCRHRDRSILDLIEA
jgi:hypothetical protein